MRFPQKTTALLFGLLLCGLAGAEDTACEHFAQKHDTKYDNIRCIDDRTAVVAQGGKLALMDADNKAVVPFGTYDYFYTFNMFKHGDTVLLNVEKDEKEGIIDGRGKVILPTRYHSVSLPEKNGKLIAFQPEENGTVGLADLSGNIVSEAQYHSIILPEQEGDPVIIQQPSEDGMLYGLLDETGKIILKPSYYAIEPFYEGLAAYSPDPVRKYGSDNEAARFGFLDRQGKTVIPPQFSNDIGVFGAGVVWAEDADSKDTFLVNRQGERLLRAPYTHTTRYKFDNNGLSIVENNMGLHGLLNNSGKTVLPFEYKYINYKDGQKPHYYELSSPDGKMGMADDTGKVVVPAEFDYFVGINNEMPEQVILGRGLNVHIFDMQGKQITERPAKYARQCAHVELGMPHKAEASYTVWHVEAEGNYVIFQNNDNEKLFGTCQHAGKQGATRSKSKKRRS